MNRIRGYIAEKFNSNLVVLVVIVIFVIMLTLITDRFLPDQFRLKQTTDYVYYYFPVGESLFNGNGLILNGMPAVRYPPGMPLLVALSLEIKSLTNIDIRNQQKVLVIIYMAGAALSLFHFSKGFLEKSKWIWVTPLVLLTYPFYLWLGQKPNSELPFIFTFFFSLYLLNSKQINYTIALFAGFLIGFSMLIRPIAIGCGIILAIMVLFLSRKSLKQRILLAIIFLLGNLLCVLPWELWAYRETGDVIPLSSGGAPSIIDGLTFGMNDKNYRVQGVGISKTALPLMHEIFVHREEFETTGQIIRFLSSKFAEKPVEVSMLLLTKAFRSWYATDSGRSENYILLLQIPYILISLFAFYCCIQLGNQYKNLAIIIIVLVLYFWLMTIVALSILRYMVPTMGLLFCLWPAIPEFFIRKLGHDEKLLYP